MSQTVEAQAVRTPALMGRSRYRHILRFAAWHLSVTWWFEILLPRLGMSRLAARGREARQRRFARRFRALAVELGGLMIKVGQFMSSRLDVLPPEITAELAGLQDEVPPVPFAQIRTLAEAELAARLETVYVGVDPEPVAAASLGQVHRASLRSGAGSDGAGSDGAGSDGAGGAERTVVVKVQRPGIDQIVDVDLAALRKVGRWLTHVKFVSRRADVPALVEEFAATSLEEIDYLNEAANAERFAAAFAADPRVSVPAVHWERTTRRVLTLEDVGAIKISDLAALEAAGIDPKEVAHKFASVMFEQLFSKGFFHADPHPGNIFITPASGQDATDPWKLTFVDFGMMGTVPEGTRRGLRTLLIAAAGRDGTGLVAAMADIGVLLPSADTRGLERAMSALFARFGGMGFAQLRDVDQREFRDFGREFGEVMRSLPFQLPDNFLLIIRAMSLTSGVCSTLDPDFNLWDAIEPFAQELLRQERGNLATAVSKELLDGAMTAVRLPKRLDRFLSSAEQGSLQTSSRNMERSLARLSGQTRRVASFVLFGAVLVAGAVVRGSDQVFGTVLMSVSLLPLLHGIWVGRSRR